jgi:hypothetical protein
VKTYTTCLIEKVLEDFYREKVKKDGRKNVCKLCVNKSRKEYCKNNKELMRSKAKKIGSTREFKDKRNLYKKNNPEKSRGNVEKANKRSRRWEVSNKEKKRAHDAVARAIKSGKLSRQPCSVCSRTDDVEGHHEDYTKVLEVVWLCPQHHNDVHIRKGL